MKASELIGPALDWAVAKCEGSLPHIEPSFDGLHILVGSQGPHDYFPSTNWAQGGPIIEQENFCLMKCSTAWRASGANAVAAYGQTPLIAAMRCFVASKLGDEVEIPEELA